MSKKLSPEYTTKPVSAGKCVCLMGYAPTDNADRSCMYCDHVVRSTCHIDFGRDQWGNRILEMSPLPARCRIRYAEQTSIYMGHYWLDLRTVRNRLDEALSKVKAADGPDDLFEANEALFTAVSHVARMLPEGYER